MCSSDLKAAEIKLVNFSFPADKLREETLRVANDLKKKNPAALRATKEAVRHVRGMNHDQAYQYLAAKLSELNLKDKDKGMQKGLSQFLDDKSYRPGFESLKN